MIIDKIQKKDEKPRIEANQKKQQEYRLIGKERRIAGHTLFSFNTVTGEVKAAQIERKAQIGFNGEPIFKTEVKTEKDCIYFQALNLKNAKKKAVKLINKYKAV